MNCINCGQQNNENFQFCTNCGQPIQTVVAGNVYKAPVAKKQKNGRFLIISISAVLLAVIVLALIFTANPVAGRWYSQSGTELLLLQNGKGMTVSDNSDEAHRAHFMYAIEYQEQGYIEGEIYEKDSGTSTWFYLYDGALELDNEYFYRQKPSVPMK